jgi:hypothetical protein
MVTMVPVGGTFGWKIAVQLGGAKMASARSRPTLRASVSIASTNSISAGP